MTDALYNEDDRVFAERVNEQALAQPEYLVTISEQRVTRQIRNACSRISENLPRTHVVLLAGPSASGKTITAHRFRRMLKEEFDINSYVVSLDDFYIDQSRLPALPDGSIDLETVHALDIGCIHRCFDELTSVSTASLPTFDFLSASRSKVTNDIVLGENDVLIVEGIHALNPLITQELDPTRFFRLFISVSGEYSLGGTIILNHTDIRFIRRCVRDYYHRDSSLEKTTGMWTSVRAGEKRYISPFKRYADLTIDSLLFYEPCIFRHLINPLIEEMDDGQEFYPKFARIHDALEYFVHMDRRFIPEDSLLREFID